MSFCSSFSYVWHFRSERSAGAEPKSFCQAVGQDRMLSGGCKYRRPFKRLEAKFCVQTAWDRCLD
jgi:hypothetical protein